MRAVRAGHRRPRTILAQERSHGMATRSLRVSGPLCYTAGMKTHHAVALALVGWYLLAPPRLHGSYDTGAPLTRWFQDGRYNSAVDCAKGKEHAAVTHPGSKEWIALW